MKAKSGLTRFHNCQILRDGKIIKEDLWIRDGKIVNPEQVFYIEQVEEDVRIDAENFLIAPGFIDIQINGGWGVDFSFDSENVEEGVDKVAKQLLAHGITSFCPTMVTSDTEKYTKILPRIHKKQGGKHGATVLGVHLEGPFINTTKKGAHADVFIKNPEKGLDTVLETYGAIDNVIIVTLAPELPGALDAIKGLTKMGVRVAVGHSAASLAEGEEAIKCGANLITHLFNAMLPFHHRDPGLVGLLASTTDKQVYYGIIADGIHTHPAALRIACRTNKEGLVLVSDAVAAQGLADGSYHIGPQTVTVEGGRAYVSGTKVLCGSTSGLDQCVKVFKESTDCSLEYALETASLHPAKALGIENRKGNLNFGCDADFVILHPETLQVLSTWISGECVYKKE
ncbi:N-acetylglucosamine-6-phosphate deacetylase [Aricia agestis]|uniref:N-acetylglucosamine-6-phosphate deacetylase n=1 Tax=Aricia agestis TaxID=91739 RepID=UPI001C205A9F|nr:N-acetylglucosamine-6-phosphate deacetylase [Aricia agestis]XP_041973167.1 N-acetylglucosamine-6-phosphate deacetylase [Aricia agestis]XP_041973168.1 N-acetylglucosamine-6-phosphate deacetylase [Aricia agestis]